MPVGWRIAFGDMIIEEIDQQLQKEGDDARNNYEVHQIKEKFGELRWYDNGSSEVHKIINKYSVISHNVCVYCGKPDVPVHIKGWIYPVCKDCYNKYDRCSKNYDEVIDKDDTTIPNEYTIRTYSVEKGYEDTTYDISETVQKVRDNYMKGD
jgi:hypothetical protein